MHAIFGSRRTVFDTERDMEMFMSRHVLCMATGVWVQRCERGQEATQLG